MEITEFNLRVIREALVDPDNWTLDKPTDIVTLRHKIGGVYITLSIEEFSLQFSKSALLRFYIKSITTALGLDFERELERICEKAFLERVIEWSLEFCQSEISKEGIKASANSNNLSFVNPQ